jgi:hypothetical protein
MTISDLEELDDESRAEHLKAYDSLRFLYMRLIEQRTEDVKYQVRIPTGSSRKPGVHASEVSGCARALTYGIGGMERRSNNTNTNMHMRFAVGHAVHSMLQHDFHSICSQFAHNRATMSFKDEVKIDPSLGGAADEWNIQSSCDGVFTWYEEGGPVRRLGLEIKTESEKGFLDLHQPREKHRAQTTIYMKCLDLPMMWVLYYNKSNSNFTSPSPPWLFQFNRNYWDQMERKIADATIAARGGILPKKEETYECSWCPFTWTCKPKSAKEWK